MRYYPLNPNHPDTRDLIARANRVTGGILRLNNKDMYPYTQGQLENLIKDWTKGRK